MVTAGNNLSGGAASAPNAARVAANSARSCVLIMAETLFLEGHQP
jgi:hypothetical protein